jgi:RNA polymerase sigma-70 factor (ECF subfamily)
MTHRLMPDNQLVQLMAEGDREACAELRDRHGLSVYAQLYVALGRAEAAEQVVSETFDLAWHAAGEFNPRAGSALVWLSSLARTLAARRRAAPAAL